MVPEWLRAGMAAERVGYESSSQFSREFKRLFGDGPAAVAALGEIAEGWLHRARANGPMTTRNGGAVVAQDAGMGTCARSQARARFF